MKTESRTASPTLKRVDIRAQKGAEELLEGEFYDLAGDIWIEDEAGGVRITCYPADAGRLLAYLAGTRLPVLSVKTTDEKKKDYAGEVRRYFTPVRIGGLTILPPWRRPGKVRGPTIVIEPGMAFGTGRHESTKLMVNLMGTVPLEGRTVLDIGSGSGILAINASLSGASSVAAIDRDPVAAEAMKKNFSLNRRPCILSACADIDAVKGEFDIVLANLDFDTFKAHASAICRKVARPGHLVVSGIEAQYWERLPSLFSPLALVSKRKMGDWYGFVFETGPAWPKGAGG